MLVRKFAIAVAATAAMTTVAALAQNASAPAQNAAAPPPPTPQVSAVVPDGGVPEYVRPETPEKRKERLGTAEDPGLDPDPNAHYWRFGKAYHITKFERRLAVYDTGDVNTVRPLGMVNFAYEIYQQNQKYLWCWVPDVDETQTKEGPEYAAAISSYSQKDIAYLALVRPDFTALTPPESGKTITFAESSDGLPQAGSWRNSLAIADMNEDGFPDLIVPPARKGNGTPHIFLGDGKGHWRDWTEVTWPHGLDYGGVVAADFNRDGHMDLAFAVHLNGVYVFLGDGKGHFTESSEGLPRDFPTRRLAVTDLDGDGYPDIVASTEGPTALESGKVPYGRLRGYLNRKKGMAWEGINIVDPNVYIGGDWLSVGHFNSDRTPDFIASSIYFGSNQVAELSAGPKKWKPFEANGLLLPSRAYYLASAVGKFGRNNNDEAIISYVRYWPGDLDTRIVSTPPITELTGVDRLIFTKGGPKRIPIISWSGHAGVHGIATGDFDGDGKLDVIITREEPGQREAIILLGDGKGGFSKGRIEGLKVEENNLYDIKVADLNGDGRPDVILMYETSEIRREDFMRMAVRTQSGSIRVFLNRGVKEAAPVKAAK